jgi:hypothetical protein
MSLLVLPELLDPVEPIVVRRLLGHLQKRIANVVRGVIEMQATSRSHAVGVKALGQGNRPNSCLNWISAPEAGRRSAC